MSFEIDVEAQLGDTRVGACFASNAGLTALIGPSGAGKTSILNMVAGLLPPARGQIVVNGRTLFDSKQNIDVPPEQRRAGYIFQEARLFPHRRVAGNLLYGNRLAAPDQRWITLEEITAFLGIAHLLERWPTTLSGGEARRVAIGRALLSGPRFLLMDEPLASLDGSRRDEIMAVIERIRDQLGLPILYVTHDTAEVERLAGNRIAIGRHYDESRQTT